MVAYALGMPFILCYFATQASENVQSIGDSAFDDLSWFRLPTNLRRKIWMIILRSQSPVHFMGLKLIPCTLEMFTVVSAKIEKTNFLSTSNLNIFLQLVKFAFSYYLILSGLSTI